MMVVCHVRNLFRISNTYYMLSNHIDKGLSCILILVYFFVEGARTAGDFRACPLRHVLHLSGGVCVGFLSRAHSLGNIETFQCLGKLVYAFGAPESLDWAVSMVYLYWSIRVFHVTCIPII